MQDICLSAADHRAYYSVGYALIQSIKSLATFEPEDLESAIQCCKDSILIAQLLRKKDHGLFENVGRLAKGSTSVSSIKSMTMVQRHAELIYSAYSSLSQRRRSRNLTTMCSGRRMHPAEGCARDYLLGGLCRM